jgi:hypothetical protein
VAARVSLLLCAEIRAASVLTLDGVSADGR